MTGAWIKMRVSIDADPQVIDMARRLAADPHFHRWALGDTSRDCHATVTRDKCDSAVTGRDSGVTCHISRAVVIAGLLRVWGSVREHGRRESDDAILSHASLETIDTIADVPGFGAAMEAVGWVVRLDGDSLRFPKFFIHNADRESQTRSNAAERQRRKRDRDRAQKAQDEGATGGDDVTPASRDMSQRCRVTVTPKCHVEKRREEESINTPLNPLPGGTDGSTTDEKAVKSETGKPPAAVALPAALDTPEFRSAWEQWEQHRRELKKPLKPTTRTKQLKQLAEWGAERAIAALEFSMRQGWEGIFEDRRPAAPSRTDTTPRSGLDSELQEIIDRRPEDCARLPPRRPPAHPSLNGAPAPEGEV